MEPFWVVRVAMETNNLRMCSEQNLRLSAHNCANFNNMNEALLQRQLCWCNLRLSTQQDHDSFPSKIKPIIFLKSRDLRLSLGQFHNASLICELLNIPIYYYVLLYWFICATIQKFRVGKFLKMFLKISYLPRLHSFEKIQ